MKRLKFTVLLVFAFFMCAGQVGAQPKMQPEDSEDYLDLAVSQALDREEKTDTLQEASRAEIAPAEAPAKPEIKIAASAQPKEAPGRKNVLDVLELKDMDILDVLKLISKKSGLNIVSGKNVRGKLTIFLKDVDVWDALQIILETNELAYVEEGNIVKVMTDKDYELTYGRKFGDKTETKIVALKFATASDLIPLLTQMKSIVGKVMVDEKSNTVVLMDAPDKVSQMLGLIKEIDVPVVTRIFNLNYASADDIEKKMAEILTKNVGKIKVDSRSNKIFITDTPTKMSQIESIIAAFDERHREVLIEAKIVKVILSDQYKMGVNWEGILKKYKNLDFKGAFDILTSTDKRGSVSIGTLADDNYTALIQALQEVGTTNTLSSPRITALNNEEAKIMVGSSEPYVTTTTTTPASGPTTTAEAINFIDVGVKLYVTPTINKDNFITMKIRPEVSSVDRSLTTSQNNKIPIVDTSVAETKIMVKDGETIVIGGLIKDESIESVKKVPFLGDLPLLGFAFRNKDKLVKKTELVIFLTPHITYGESSPSDIKNTAKIAHDF